MRDTAVVISFDEKLMCKFPQYLWINSKLSFGDTSTFI